jgi:hypothetical protein
VKLSKTTIAISFGGLLCLLTAVIFLSIRQRPSPTKISQAPSLLTPAPTFATKPKERPKPRESSAVAQTPSTPAKVPATPRPVSAAVLTRCTEVIHQKYAAKKGLGKLVNADPETSEVTEAKLRMLERPLFFITLTQSLEDPLLRPAVMDSLRSDRSSWPDWIDKEAMKFGYLALGRDYTAERAAAMLKTLEPHFQAEYQRLLEKAELSEEMAQAYDTVAVGETLENVVIGYMMKLGYIYNPDRQRFESRNQQ